MEGYINTPKLAQLVQRLAEAQVLSGLPEADRMELAHLALRRHLRPGQILVRQGEFCTNVLLLNSGTVRAVMSSAAGHEYLLGTMHPNAVYFHCLFGDEPMPASLVAVEVAEVYLWPREAMRPILERNPAALFEIGQTLLKSLHRASDIIYGLAFQPVAGRLAKLLLAQITQEENTPAERDLSLQEIASMVASSPEVISRLLHQFEVEGILDITRTTIVLRNRAQLERLGE